MEKRTKLISHDIIKMVQSECNKCPNIEPFVIDGYTTINIGKVTITIAGPGARPVIHLDEDYNGSYNNVWRDDVGFILYKELKKDWPELYEFKCNLFKALMKRVNEDEMQTFLDNNMVHMHIGNSIYTIIKVVKGDDSYATRDILNDYNLDEIIVDNKPDDEPEEDNYPIIRSLF